MDDEAHHGTPELAPGLRRLNEDGLIVWGDPDRIATVFVACTSKTTVSIPERSSPGRSPLPGLFLFYLLNTNLSAWIFFIQCVIDVLLFHLSIVLVNKSLHTIQDH